MDRESRMDKSVGFARHASSSSSGSVVKKSRPNDTNIWPCLLCSRYESSSLEDLRNHKKVCLTQCHLSRVPIGSNDNGGDCEMDEDDVVDIKDQSELSSNHDEDDVFIEQQGNNDVIHWKGIVRIRMDVNCVTLRV